jgi:tetratricopeptide (TPR) repeat protein
MGSAYSRQGKLEEAVAAYEKAIEIDPDYGEAYGDMAGTLADLDRIPEAVAAGEKGVELAPDYSVGHYNLAYAYRLQGELEKAIAEYEEAIRLDPDDPDPHTSLGTVYQDQGRLDEAIAEFQEAIRLDPDDPDLHISLGQVYRDQDRFDEAIAEFQEAIRLDPDDPRSHNGLGVVYAMQDRIEDAIDEWLKAIAIDPDYAIAHKNLGVAYRDLGRTEEAIAEFEAYLQLRPDAPDRAAIEGEIAELEEMLASPVAEYRNDEGGYSLVYPKTLHYADEDAWVAFSESQEAVDAVFDYATDEAFQEAPVFMVNVMPLEDILDTYDLGIAADSTDILEASVDGIGAEIDATQTATLDGYPSTLGEISGDANGVSFRGALVVVVVDERVIIVFGLALPDQWDAFFPTYLDMVNSLSFFEASLDVMPTKAAP